jgi:hypothetical protein
MTINKILNLPSIFRVRIYRLKSQTVSYCRVYGAIPNQDRYSLRSEVPIRVAILHKSRRHSRHRAVDDFLRIKRGLRARLECFHISEGQYKLGDIARVEQVCYTIIGDSL